MNQTNAVLLSVVVPAHQCADVLARALAALRASDEPACTWELIVVDDGSSDATSEIGDGFRRDAA